jgi:hypothetical protein
VVTLSAEGGDDADLIHAVTVVCGLETMSFIGYVAWVSFQTFQLPRFQFHHSLARPSCMHQLSWLKDLPHELGVKVKAEKPKLDEAIGLPHPYTSVPEISVTLHLANYDQLNC